MNKFLLYVRQAFALMKEDKSFSAIYIAGTAVAIASAMVVALILHIRVGNIYPEVNRDRTIYVGSNFTRSDGGFIGYEGYSLQAMEEMFSKLECAEVVSAVMGNDYLYRFTACAEIGKQEVQVASKFTDPNFFRLYEFKFVEGKPYDEENLKNADRCVVITDAVAKKLYGTTQGVVGQSLQLNYLPYRVVGIVKEVSPLLKDSSADIYMPYTVEDSRAHWHDENVTYAGGLEVRVLLKKGYTREMLMKELEPYKAKYLSMLKSTTGEEWNWYIQVRPHWRKTLNFFPGKEVNDASTSDLLTNLIPPALLILLFLLLPAINLSGMVSNQMEARVAEMGIRKAFGANRRVLLNEVIQENLVLTLCGGVVGYLLSWLFITVVRNSTLFLTLFEREYDPVDNVSLQLDMFFTPTLFLIAFLCCAVLNLMAALIPAWTSLKKPIVESLNQKK
ncbi:MAG: ABC transporter permease [Bacteroidaceae bacterium]|nr:ABC transporter permease [Bacteroidaceae bacterium]